MVLGEEGATETYPLCPCRQSGAPTGCVLELLSRLAAGSCKCSSQHHHHTLTPVESTLSWQPKILRCLQGLDDVGTGGRGARCDVDMLLDAHAMPSRILYRPFVKMLPETSSSWLAGLHILIRQARFPARDDALNSQMRDCFAQ